MSASTVVVAEPDAERRNAVIEAIRCAGTADAVGVGSLAEARDRRVFAALVLSPTVPDAPDPRDPLSVVRAAVAWDPSPAVVLLGDGTGIPSFDSLIDAGGQDVLNADDLRPDAVAHAIDRATAHHRRVQRIHAALTSEQVRSGDLEAYARAVSHDLRAPMANVLGLARTLEMLVGEDGPWHRETIPTLATRIIANTSTALRFADELLAETLRDGLVNQVVDLDEVTLDALTQLGLPDDLTLMLETDGLCVLGRPGGVRQIVGNLLTNAVQFAGPRGTVAVSVRPLGEMVELLVEDTGPGVPLHSRDEVTRLGVSTRPDGHGIGLHSVLRHASAMGGTFTIGDSARLGGALMRVTLPAVPEDVCLARRS